MNRTKMSASPPSPRRSVSASPGGIFSQLKKALGPPIVGSMHIDDLHSANEGVAQSPQQPRRAGNHLRHGTETDNGGSFNGTNNQGNGSTNINTAASTSHHRASMASQALASAAESERVEKQRQSEESEQAARQAAAAAEARVRSELGNTIDQLSKSSANFDEEITNLRNQAKFLQESLAEANEKNEKQTEIIASVREMHLLRPHDSLVLHYDPLTGSGSIVGCPNFLKRAISRRSRKLMLRNELERRRKVEADFRGTSESSLGPNSFQLVDYLREQKKRRLMDYQQFRKEIHIMSSSSSEEEDEEGEAIRVNGNDETSSTSSSAEEDTARAHRRRERRVERRRRRRENKMMNAAESAINSMSQHPKVIHMIPLGIQCVTSCGPNVTLPDAVRAGAVDVDRFDSHDNPQPYNSPQMSLPACTTLATPSFCTFCGCRYARIVSNQPSHNGQNSFILPRFCTKCGRPPPRYLANDLPPPSPMPLSSTSRVQQQRVHIDAFKLQKGLGDVNRHEDENVQNDTNGRRQPDHENDTENDNGTTATTDDVWAEALLAETSIGRENAGRDDYSTITSLLAPSARYRIQQRYARLGRSILCDASTQTKQEEQQPSTSTHTPMPSVAQNHAQSVANQSEIISSPNDEFFADENQAAMGDNHATMHFMATRNEDRQRHNAALKAAVTATVNAERERTAHIFRQQQATIEQLTLRIRALEEEKRAIASETERRIQREMLGSRVEDQWKSLLMTVEGCSRAQTMSK